MSVALSWSALTNHLLTYSMVQSPSWEANWLQLVKKFPAFHGTRRFITALTSVGHLSLSWTSPIQSTYPHTTSWRSIRILSTHLRLGLPSGLLPSGFPSKTLYTPSPHQYAPHAQPISFFSILSTAQNWVRSTNHLAPRYAISSIPPLHLVPISCMFSTRRIFLSVVRIAGQSDHPSHPHSPDDRGTTVFPFSTLSPIHYSTKCTEYKLRKPFELLFVKTSFSLSLSLPLSPLSLSNADC